MGNKHEILLGLTTTPGSNWRGKVAEMKKFGIKKIALFPTFLEINNRKKLYDLLEDISDLEIPHVHLRGEDMEEWEMEWFEKRGAVAYNIHMGEHDAKILQPFRKKIFVENHSYKTIPEKQIVDNAGICLDFQHWQDAKEQQHHVAEETEKYAHKFTVGCCHVSPLTKEQNLFLRIFKRAGAHYMSSLSELDYMKNYKKYLPHYISLEMENSFKEQLEAKKYLEKIIEE